MELKFDDKKIKKSDDVKVSEYKFEIANLPDDQPDIINLPINTVWKRDVDAGDIYSYCEVTLNKGDVCILGVTHAKTHHSYVNFPLAGSRVFHTNAGIGFRPKTGEVFVTLEKEFMGWYAIPDYEVSTGVIPCIFACEKSSGTIKASLFPTLNKYYDILPAYSFRLSSDWVFCDVVALVCSATDPLLPKLKAELIKVALEHKNDPTIKFCYDCKGLALTKLRKARFPEEPIILLQSSKDVTFVLKRKAEKKDDDKDKGEDLNVRVSSFLQTLTDKNKRKERVKQKKIKEKKGTTGKREKGKGKTR